MYQTQEEIEEYLQDINDYLTEMLGTSKFVIYDYEMECKYGATTPEIYKCTYFYKTKYDDGQVLVVLNEFPTDELIAKQIADYLKEK